MSNPPENVIHGYEYRDLKIAPLFASAAVLAATILVVFIGLGLVLRFYMGRENAIATTHSPRLDDPSGLYPPPRLQGDAAADLAKLRARDAQALSRYDWVDRQAGIATIPIDRAMEILAEKGLPTQTVPNESASPEPSP